jgi:hypothetical protein
MAERSPRKPRDSAKKTKDAGADHGKGISREEVRSVEDLSTPRTLVIYEVVRRLGDEEMERPATSLWWSGIAAGLSISFSLLAQAIQNIPAACIGQSFEHRIHGHNMQPFGCLSSQPSHEFRWRNLITTATLTTKSSGEGTSSWRSGHPLPGTRRSEARTDNRTDKKALASARSPTSRNCPRRARR